MNAYRETILRWLSRQTDKLETKRFQSLSLFAFVLMPAVVTLFNTVDLQVLYDVFMDVNVVEKLENVLDPQNWDVGTADNNDDGVGQDTDDEYGLYLYQALFSKQPSSETTSTTITQISFIILIGQIINNANKRVIEHSKVLTLLGTGSYIFLLILITGTKNVVLSILVLQFLTLGSYTLVVPVAVVWLKLRRFLSDSEEQDGGTPANKRRPRIQSPRN